MSEFHLRRRIPPLSVEEMVRLFIDDTSVSIYEAQQLAEMTYANNLEEIYRLARLGETFERLKECSDGENDFWRGYADGWNGAQKWVRDNVESDDG